MYVRSEKIKSGDDKFELKYDLSHYTLAQNKKEKTHFYLIPIDTKTTKLPKL